MVVEACAQAEKTEEESKTDGTPVHALAKDAEDAQGPGTVCTGDGYGDPYDDVENDDDIQSALNAASAAQAALDEAKFKAMAS